MSVVATAEKEIADLEVRKKDAIEKLEAAKGPLGTKDGSVLDQESPEFKAFHEASVELSNVNQMLLKAHEAFGTVKEAFAAQIGGKSAPETRAPNGDLLGKALESDDSFEKFHADVKSLLHENEEFKQAAERYAASSTGSLYGGQKKWADIGSRAELKALLVGAGLTAARKPAKRTPMIDASPLVPLTVLDLVTVGETDNPSHEYPAYLGLDGEAGMVPDPTNADPTLAALKPSVQMTFEMRTAAAKTIAATLDVHRHTLKDVPRMQQLIEEKLPEAVVRKLASQVMGGSGSGDNLRGVINQSGIGIQPRGSDTIIDAIFKAQTLSRIAGFEPEATGLHPLLWQAIRLAKDTNGNYLYGPPSQSGTEAAFGTPIVQSIAIPIATPVTGKWSEVEVLLVDPLSFLTTDSHSDFFKRNLITALAETRALLQLQFPAAMTKVTGADVEPTP